MSERRLIEVRRLVPPRRMHLYDEYWEALRAGIQGHGAHAWRFRAVADAQAFIEFVEYRAGNDPASHREVKKIMESLDGIAPGVVEEFIEASPS